MPHGLEQFRAVEQRLQPGGEAAPAPDLMELIAAAIALGWPQETVAFLPYEQLLDIVVNQRRPPGTRRDNYLNLVTGEVLPMSDDEAAALNAQAGRGVWVKARDATITDIVRAATGGGATAGGGGGVDATPRLRNWVNPQGEVLAMTDAEAAARIAAGEQWMATTAVPLDLFAPTQPPMPPLWQWIEQPDGSWVRYVPDPESPQGFREERMEPQATGRTFIGEFARRLYFIDAEGNVTSEPLPQGADEETARTPEELARAILLKHQNTNASPGEISREVRQKVTRRFGREALERALRTAPPEFPPPQRLPVHGMAPFFVPPTVTPVGLSRSPARRAEQMRFALAGTAPLAAGQNLSELGQALLLLDMQEATQQAIKQGRLAPQEGGLARAASGLPLFPEEAEQTQAAPVGTQALPTGRQVTASRQGEEAPVTRMPTVPVIAAAPLSARRLFESIGQRRVKKPKEREGTALSRIARTPINIPKAPLTVGARLAQR